MDAPVAKSPPDLGDVDDRRGERPGLLIRLGRMTVTVSGEPPDWDRLIAKENAMRKEIEDAATFLSELREELVPGKDDATVGGAAKRVASAVTWVEKTKAAAK